MELVVVMQFKESRRKHPVVVLGLSDTADAALRDFVTHQILLMLRMSMADSVFDYNGGYFKELVRFPFCGSMVFVTILNGDRFLQLILGCSLRKPDALFGNSTTSDLLMVVKLFHVLSVLNDGLQMNALTALQN